MADRESLPNAFIETDNFKKAVMPRIRLVVGRKGTGKTALFQEVAKNFLADENYKVIAIGEEEISQIRDPSNEEGSVDQDTIFDKAWETLVLELSVDAIANDGKIRKTRAPMVKDLIEVRNQFRNGQIQHKDLRKAICQNLSSLNIKLIVLIDDIDIGMRRGKYDKVSSMCVGLYLTLSRYRNNQNLQIKAFMPSDLFEPMGMKDADKFEPDHKMDLHWQSKDLLAMIERRIAISFQIENYEPMELWNQLFPAKLKAYFYGFRVPKKTTRYETRDRSSWDVILEHTFWRPRDLITLCRKIKQKADEYNIQTINQGVIEEAIEDVSSDAYRFFLNEASCRIDSLERVITQFRSKKQTMGYDSFRGVIATSIHGKSLLQEQFEHLMNSLYIFGFYGIGERKQFYSGDDENTTNFKVKFYHETAVSKIGLTSSGVVVIHPIFYKALSLFPGDEDIAGEEGII
ncbi:MAG: P-loop ATPase, Sll1717 family [Thermoleophilia bacterium]